MAFCFFIVVFKEKQFCYDIVETFFVVVSVAAELLSIGHRFRKDKHWHFLAILLHLMNK